MTIALYLLGTAAVGAVVIFIPLALYRLSSKDHEPVRGARPDWTGADFDSYEVLASIGEPHPAALVTQARATRIVRPAGVRIIRSHSGLYRMVAAVAHRGAAH
jgi:hypothetical protein